MITLPPKTLRYFQLSVILICGCLWCASHDDNRMADTGAFPMLLESLSSTEAMGQEFRFDL